VFKRLRIAVLLYVLLFVAAAQFFTSRYTTDWDAPLWVDIYTVAGDGLPVTRHYIDSMSAIEFADAEAFFAREAKRYGVTLEPGKLADFVVLDGDPLVHVADTLRIIAVAKGGVWRDRSSLRSQA